MYCRKCKYDLSGFAAHRCPECSTPFDPSDPSTFLTARPRALKSILRASAFLFLITALATGWQTLQLILWGFWGRPSNPFEHVALAGALVLMIGALVTFCSRPPGPVIAMVGCAILWIYYGPALWHTFAQVFSRQLALNLLVFLPPLLLVASSTLAIMTLVTRRGLSEQSAPFPIRKSRHIVFERLALGAIAAIVIVVVLALPDEFGPKECFKNQYTGSSSMFIDDRVLAIFSKGVRVPSGSTFSVPDMPEHYSYIILLVHPRFLVRSGGVRRKIDHHQSLEIFSWGGVDRLKVTHQLGPV